MQSNRQPSNPRPACRFHQAGNCRREDCRFSHDVNVCSPTTPNAQSNNQQRRGAFRGRGRVRPSASGALRSEKEGHGNGVQRCTYYSRGKCNRGDNCRFSHDTELPSGSTLPQVPILEESTPPIASSSSSGQTKQQDRAERAAAREAETEARLARIVREEADQTYTKLIGGSIVTFSAGATIQSLVTGFHTSIVRVTGLPANTTINTLSLLILGQDLSSGDFHIVSHNQYKREGEVLVKRSEVERLVEAIDDAEMGSNRLSATLIDGGGVTGNSTYVLAIWWRAPSVSYVATYRSTDLAEAKARELNGRILSGRRVNVFVRRPRNAGRYFDASPSTSIILDGLPLSVSTNDVSRFTGNTDVLRQPAKDYNVDEAVAQLGHHIRLYSPVAQVTNATRPNEKMVQVRVAFDDGDAAERARISLDGQRRFSWNGNWPLYTRLDEPVQYKLSIPVRQYNVQKRQWDELAGSGAAASLRIDAPRHPGRPHVFIQISGKEKEAVGQLKVRAEDLARGQVLAAWAVGLTERFLDGVAERTGTFILRDARTRALKAFGEPAAVLAAREQIQEEEDRLAALEISIPVKPAVVAYFLRQGIPALKEELGEENVKLDGPRARCHVVVRGGEAARRAVERHIIDSATYRPSAAVDATCPVCYMEPSAPFRLGCGHIYCTACAKHLLSSATENKTFPLLCIGEDATCGVPIPIPTIRKFLAEDAVTKLFDAAFTAHIERNPDRLKYCRTAACEQVYATDGEQQFLSCPSCFATVCTGCNEGAHVGRTCRENARDVQRKHDEKLNDALIAEQNFKRCPSCQVLVEKTEGCNHISCRCGAHFCWRCTRVFPRDEIYNHMTEAHGGIYEDVRPAQAPQRAPPPQYPVPPRPREFEYDAVDVMEQHRILRDIAQRREVAQRRTIEERNRQARQTEAAQYQREAYINRQWQMEAQRLEIEQRQREEAQRRNSGWGCTVM